MKEHNKTDTYSFENGVMESSGVMWIGACAVARNVERCAMWNEAECGLGHGAIPGSGGGVLICDARERYAKHGSGMWNYV